FVMAKEESNPFKQEERKYPIDFGAPFDYVYFIKLTLPQGFVVEELPKSKVLALPGNAARYIFNVAQSGNSINITSNFSINKGVFSQDEYPNLREFYNQMVAKQAEQIVVKKQ
ncbi:MAG: transglutaminase, partial [Bacteroidota bacterium]